MTGPDHWDGLSVHVDKWTKYPKRIVPEGCIFITVKGAGVGRTFPGISCAIGRDIYAYRPVAAVDFEFMHHALRQRVSDILLHARGDIPGLSREHITDQVLELPSFAEQRRIVAKLDTLTARLARARAELARSERLAAQLRKQIHIHIFKTVSVCNHLRIDEICRVGTGATPKRDNTTYYRGGTVPWVMSGSVNDGVVTEASDYITDIAIRETNCKIYAEGSLIVALYGEGKTRGKVATLGLAAATNQALAVLHDFNFDLVEVNWVKLYLHSQYEITREQAAGGVQPNLSLGVVKGIRVPLPDLALQRKLLKVSSGLEAKANCLEAEVARARALLDRLEAAILARAFRGELVPQDPDDEPASILLDRIRASRAAAPKPSRRRRADATSA